MGRVIPSSFATCPNFSRSQKASRSALPVPESDSIGASQVWSSPTEMTSFDTSIIFEKACSSSLAVADVVGEMRNKLPMKARVFKHNRRNTDPDPLPRACRNFEIESWNRSAWAAQC